MNYKKLMAFLMIFTSAAANASSLTCPATVKAGTALTVTATIDNNDCNNPLYISKAVLNLIGNVDGKSLGLLGPYVIPLASIDTVPPATCVSVPYTPGYPQYGSYTVTTPGTQTVGNVVIIASVPTGMAGTLAVASGAVIDNNNKTIMIGSCTVPVTN